MKFHVAWTNFAEQELVQIWLGARDRARLTEVIARMERELQSIPEKIGESREPGFRILIDSPLGIHFEVIGEDRLVQVMNVWRIR